jgi:membrane-bound serine protease (ClpP class)
MMELMRYFMTRVIVVLAALAGVSAQAAEVVVFRFDDTVHPASRDFIERCLDEAAARRAALVVMEIDTPGGLVDATRDITSAITGSPVPVVVWVEPAGARAASAGFFILVSADVAAMAPGTNTGAATPILMSIIPTGGDAQPSDEMKAKITNDTTAMIRSFASARHRNMDLAVKAVTEALSFTADEALEGGLIDLVSGDLDDLLDRLDGREVRRFDGSMETLDLGARSITRLEPSRLEKFQFFLASPLVALLLMALAAVGIFTEITHPGGVVPGVVGVIALLLFLYSTTVLPVNWLAFLLIAAALVLFVLEVKVVSYGLLTAAGVVAFVVGAILLFDGPIPEMRLGLGAVLPTALVVAGFSLFLVRRVVWAHRNRPATGREGLVGEIGRVVRDLEPRGKVLVHGEYWDAVTTGPSLAAGADVRVVVVEERLLRVEPAHPMEGD